MPRQEHKAGSDLCSRAAFSTFAKSPSCAGRAEQRLGVSESISAAAGWGFPRGMGLSQTLPFPAVLVKLSAKQVLLDFAEFCWACFPPPGADPWARASAHTWGTGCPIWILVCANEGPSGLSRAGWVELPPPGAWKLKCLPPLPPFLPCSQLPVCLYGGGGLPSPQLCPRSRTLILAMERLRRPL